MINTFSHGARGPAAELSNCDQGFMTDKGRFVDRLEACKIAKSAGQIINKTGPEDDLFSEDLW